MSNLMRLWGCHVLRTVLEGEWGAVLAKTRCMGIAYLDLGKSCYRRRLSSREHRTDTKKSRDEVIVDHRQLRSRGVGRLA